MNCIRCNAPLPPDARFCRNCGEPASINVSTSQSSQFQTSAPAQSPYYQPTVSAAPVTMQSTGSAGQPPQALASRRDMPPPQRRRGRRLRNTLITLIILILIFLGAWALVVRPYLHSLAQNQLDSALSSAVNQVDLSLLSRVPAGVPIPLKVTEDNLNSFYLPLIQAPSSPVKNMHVQITPDEIRFDFTVYGLAGDIAGKPTLLNGNLIMTNVSVGGAAGLVMSSDEMTALLNRHLADIQARLHRPIASISLINHELDIILG